MKMSPIFEKAQKNMETGILTKTGFLGDDKRKLVDIIQHDEELVKSFKLDFNLIINKLEYFLNEGKKGLGEPITVENKWIVKIDEARGFIPCPFEDGVFRKININIKKIDNNLEIDYTSLSIHMIKAHHFFQGIGSEYRLEPGILKEIFNI